MNKKLVSLAFLVLLCSGNVFADNNVPFVFDITGIKTNGGKIYANVFSTEKEFKKDTPLMTFMLESRNSVITHKLDLPKGEYVISLFQDTNNNEKLDRNFFNIPKEPIGLTNYKGGLPGDFNKHKVILNENTEKITLQLIEF